jgi:hypothetical protein
MALPSGVDPVDDTDIIVEHDKRLLIVTIK